MSYEDIRSRRELPRPLGPTHVCTDCKERIDPDEAISHFRGGFICPDCYIDRRAMRDR